VTVWDPQPEPGGSETQALLFRVVKQVLDVYLPQVGK
jgi:hypothetical protein